MSKTCDSEYIWERQSGESQEAYAAFSLYRDMAYQIVNDKGEVVQSHVPLNRRSLNKVSRQISKNVQLLKTWSSKWEWVKRAESYDRFIDEEALRKATAKLAGERAKQYKIAHEMQERATEILKSKKNKDISARDAIKLLELSLSIADSRLKDDVAAHTPAEHDVTEQETLERLDDVLAQIMDTATADTTEEA